MTNEVFVFPSQWNWNKLYYSLLYGINKDGEKYEHIDLSNSFENDVFIYRPYYDGECNCGFIDRREEVYETDHENNCPTKHLYELYSAFLNLGMNDKNIQNLLQKEVERMGLKLSPKGDFHYLCLCNWKEKIQKWDDANDHLDTCSIVQANFHFKKTNFEIFCRKRKNEGLVMNQEIDFKEFQNIIRESYISLKQ